MSDGLSGLVDVYNEFTEKAQLISLGKDNPNRAEYEYAVHLIENEPVTSQELAQLMSYINREDTYVDTFSPFFLSAVLNKVPDSCGRVNVRLPDQYAQILSEVHQDTSSLENEIMKDFRFLTRNNVCAEYTTKGGKFTLIFEQPLSEHIQ